MFEMCDEVVVVVGGEIVEGVRYVMENREVENSMRKESLDRMGEGFEWVKRRYEYVRERRGVEVCE